MTSTDISRDKGSLWASTWGRYHSHLVMILGPILMLGIWYALGSVLANDDRLFAFAEMGPKHALPRFWQGITDGSLWQHASASLVRVFEGLAYAFIIGSTLGALNGRSKTLRSLTHIPFQILRMVSPLSWMPVAVMVFVAWHSAIVFIITMAAIWPIYYALTGAVKRLNPDWFALAASLKASYRQTFFYIIAPAVAPDVVQGLRLALGVAWIVLVPAELLGVNAGLGYAINDARDSLAYDQLAAVILTIGLLGFLLDSLMAWLSKKVMWLSDG